jgi:hypothetical protein
MTAVATRSRQTRPARSPVARTIRKTAPGQVTIKAGNLEDCYTLVEIPCGGAFDGRGFVCEKFGAAEPYHVFLSRNGQNDTCDCPGGTYRGKCKHVAGLRALLSRGRLDDTPAVAG